MALSLRPITPEFGVEVLDVDLAQPLSDALLDEILEAYYRHSLLLFRGQSLTPERQSEITQSFGTAKKASKIRHAMEDLPIISRIGNIKENGQPTAFLNRQGVEWHSDGAGAPENDIATFLYAVETPEVGGDTMFANMYLAYEALSPGMKKLIEGLHAIHFAGTRKLETTNADQAH
ncbi:MAG: TauD/TfdA dioxygenase family protein, partial [Elsteraceae bacterium]